MYKKNRWKTSDPYRSQIATAAVICHLLSQQYTSNEPGEIDRLHRVPPERMLSKSEAG
jgi:hypothetical protein